MWQLNSERRTLRNGVSQLPVSHSQLSRTQLLNDTRAVSLIPTSSNRNIDLQHYATLYSNPLGEAPIHAMGLFEKPQPTHPPDKWVYMVFLKHEPSLGNDPAKMFSFVRAGPVPYTAVCILGYISLPTLRSRPKPFLYCVTSTDEVIVDQISPWHRSTEDGGCQESIRCT